MPKLPQTDLLVVGAGPVGMFTALCASECGLSVRIVDKYKRTALHSYGLTLHSRSLRLLEELGLADQLTEHGQIVDRVRIYNHKEQAAEIRLDAQGGPFPFVLAVPQSLLEGALERRLSQNAVEILWGHQLSAFTEGPQGVHAAIAKVPDDPDEFQVEAFSGRASYLIGADGYDSMTRRVLGLERVRVGDPVSYGLLEFDGELSAETMNLIFSDFSADVLWPLGPERGRWAMQLDDPEQANGVTLRQMIGARAPWFAKEFGPVHWTTSVTFQPGYTRHFGQGRVWLVGDAAHSTSPLGVQSMNIGFREAHGLVRRLSRILHHEGPDKLLEYYDDDRAREWRMMLGIKDRLAIRESAPAWARKFGFRLLRSLPASGNDLNRLLDQVGLRLSWLRGKNRGR